MNAQRDWAVNLGLPPADPVKGGYATIATNPRAVVARG
jgi:hypothetical protein